VAEGEALVSKCRGCEAPIKWVAVRPNGKSHPVDPEPVDPEDGPIVALIAVADDPAGGEAFVVSQYTTAEQLRGRTLHRSHFSTCPQAEKFRRKK
jgi:hypothetical protein